MDNQQPQINVLTIQKNISDFCDDTLGVRAFEEWLYNTPVLEAILGSNLYLEIISTDFNKQTSLAKTKKNLRQWLTEGRIVPSIEYVNTMQSSYEKRIDNIREKCEKLLKEKDFIVIKTLQENSVGFPSIARALSHYETLADFQHAYFLERKTHPAVKTAKKVLKLANDKRSALERLKIAVARIDYYENLFPWLSDYIDIDIDTLLDDVTSRNESDYDDSDPICKYLVRGEYEKLSPVERNELALERYWIGRKKPWQLGRDYERYVGYLYEMEGYDVRYFGIEAGLGDLGRDLICSQNSETLIVQCKYWSSNKIIHEKHISQLFGTTVMYDIEQRASTTWNSLSQVQFKPVFVTSTTLSDKALEFAKHLNVTVRQSIKLEKYPCVKCNVIGHSGDKIYHLPMDQQYDNLVTSRKNRFYLNSVAEAEKQGFRRAWKWRGSQS